MRINKMEVLSRPLNKWDKTSIRPGPVGSVGDVNTSVRYKQSSIDLAPRYSKEFSGKQGENSGSNVSDGMWHSYTSGGRVARTIREPFGYRQGFKTSVGWIKEDVRAPDTTRQTQVGSIGNFGYQSQIAQVQKAKVTGELFLPLPGGYSKELGGSQIPRGSQIPIIAAESEGLGKALPAAAVKVTDPRFGENGSIENPQTRENCEYVIDPNVYWTPPAGHHYRVDRPYQHANIRYYRITEHGRIYNTYDWLLDSDEPQMIYDRESETEFQGVANHKGGIQRPKDEPGPACVQVPIGGRVPKPNPYEYGKPGDRLPVPGQPSSGPIGGVPGGGNNGGGGSGTGSGLQCRSGNCKGLFR